MDKREETKDAPPQKTENGQMINYETFESSSENEMDRGLFESAALSYQNKEKIISSKEKEDKRLERVKRKERKVNEKLK